MQDDNNQNPTQGTPPQAPQWTAEQYTEYQRQLAAAQAEQANVTQGTGNSTDPYSVAQQYTEEQWAQPLAQPNEVDQRIAQEYAQMSTLVGPPKPSLISSIFSGLVAHKVLAIALILSFFTIGTLTTLFVKYGGTKSNSQSTASTTSEDSLDTGDAEDTSADSESDVTPSDSEDESAVSDEDTEAISDDEVAFDDTSTEDLTSYDEGDGGDSGLGNETETGTCDQTDPTSECYVPVDDPPTPPPPTPVTTSFSVVTYHIKSTMTPAQVVADLKNLYSQNSATVIALQGTVDTKYASAINANMISCASCAYAGYLPTTNDSSDVPIIWQKSAFTMRVAGSKRVTGRTKIGTSTMRALYINTVLLKNNATNKSVYVLNVHTPGTGEKNGKPTAAAINVSLFQQEMTSLKDKISVLAAKNGNAIIVAGSYYVDYRSDSTVKYASYPYATLKQVGTYANWQRLGPVTNGTVSGSTRLVDYVHSRDHTLLSMTNQTRLASAYTNSDHYPIKVSFSLKDR